jgi:hypothetical protein
LENTEKEIKSAEFNIRESGSKKKTCMFPGSTKLCMKLLQRDFPTILSYLLKIDLNGIIQKSPQGQPFNRDPGSSAGIKETKFIYDIHPQTVEGYFNSLNL